MTDDFWPELFTVAEVAARLRVSKMTVYRLVHDEELESMKIGRSWRIPEAAVRKYLAKQGVELP